MLAFLEGYIDYIEENTIALHVGGVGYEVYATNSAISKYADTKDKIRLYTYLQAKEDGVTLFGFAGREEKTMFLKLITVSGVGAKTAVGILSGVQLPELAAAIVTGDITALSRAKGIGKKTAERIILELREKVAPFSASDSLPKSGGGASFSNPDSEAVEALMALGITRAESLKAVNIALNQGCVKVEEIISCALKNL